MWPVSLSQNGAQMRNINIPWPKSNLFWMWSEYINRQIWGHSCLVFSRKCPEIANLACFIKSKWGKSTNDYQNLISSQSGEEPSAWQISGNSKNQLCLWCHHKDKMKRYNWKKNNDCQKYKIAILAKSGTYAYQTDRPVKPSRWIITEN